MWMTIIIKETIVKNTKRKRAKAKKWWKWQKYRFRRSNENLKFSIDSNGFRNWKRKQKKTREIKHINWHSHIMWILLSSTACINYPKIAFSRFWCFTLFDSLEQEPVVEICILDPLSLPNDGCFAQTILFVLFSVEKHSSCILVMSSFIPFCIFLIDRAFIGDLEKLIIH